MEKIKIFDTTLRDGEQSPSCSMTLEEKIKVAKALENLGVDIIEAGFAASSLKDKQAIIEISKAVSKPVVTSLARLVKKDIDDAYESLKFAKKARIHVFIATSKIHMRDKLEMSEEEVLTNVSKYVTYAKQLVDDIEFSAEDATRSDISFLTKVLQTAINCGATTINIPDTVGYLNPIEYMEFINQIKQNLIIPDSVTLSCHCHNDLGMAVANSLSSVLVGVKQIECTINGIGERAGNASLGEIVAGLAVRKDYYHKETNINKKEIYSVSKLIAEIVNSPIPRNQPIVGENAFKHEAGIHQHGILKNEMTYEIMKAEDYGINYDPIVIGIHSGHHAVIEKIKQLGLDVDNYSIPEITQNIKEICEKKEKIDNETFLSIINQHKISRQKTYHKK